MHGLWLSAVNGSVVSGSSKAARHDVGAATDCLVCCAKNRSVPCAPLIRGPIYYQSVLHLASAHLGVHVRLRTAAVQPQAALPGGLVVVY